MPQLFHRSANYVARGSIVGIAAFGGIAVGILLILSRSSYVTGAGVHIKQPVPFSHEHHVSGLGIDCRYCHTAVEKSSSAGIPPTATCYNCHKLIWKDAPMLAPIRDSFRTGKPIEWVRVHDLPDFVFFNHSIHVAKGVGCASCHGAIDQMQLTYQAKSLQMEWCLECHRDPAKFIRPRSEVFNMKYEASDEAKKRNIGVAQLGAELVQKHNVRGPFALTGCDMCHR